MKSKASSTPTRNYNTLDQSMEEDNISIICESIGLGAKRRSDTSPSKDIQLLRMSKYGFIFAHFMVLGKIYFWELGVGNLLKYNRKEKEDVLFFPNCDNAF